jgi:hypothetical protein
MCLTLKMVGTKNNKLCFLSIFFFLQLTIIKIYKVFKKKTK